MSDRLVNTNTIIDTWVRSLIDPFIPKPKKVIINPPATIIHWTDGTKTVVKCSRNDIYDPEKGFVICCMKRIYGKQFKNFMEEWVNQDVINKAHAKYFKYCLNGEETCEQKEL